MRKEFFKQNKGITLIALVVTIIVLLILAGVAISMLSGENGILKQAAEAKTKTELSQKSENTELKSMEIIMDFKTANSKLKVFNGCVANIEPGTLVSELKLPNGYSLANIDGTDIQNTSTPITTGMMLKKDGEEVGRIVIYGDTDCNGEINILDGDQIYYYIRTGKLYQNSNGY